MNNVLVVVARPDDEVSGCGWAITLHSEACYQAHVLIVSEGAISPQQQRARDSAKAEPSGLGQSAHLAGVNLGANGMERLVLLDNRLDSLERLDLIKWIEDRIPCYQHQVVYLNDAGDVKMDPRRLHAAVVTICLSALAAFASEMYSWLHARLIDALEQMARWQGAKVGVEAAEEFCLLRQLA